MQIDTVITKISDTLTNHFTIQYINEKSKLGGISLDVIVTVSITILVFFLGIVGQYLFELWKKNKYYKDIYDFFINNIENAIANIKKEEKLRNDAIFYIKNIKNFNKFNLSSSLISFAVFYDIPRNDLYKSFLKYYSRNNREDNKKIFLNISDLIKNIYRRKEDFAKINEEYNKEFSDVMRKYELCLVQLNLLKINLEKDFLNNQFNSKTIEFYSDIIGIYEGFTNKMEDIVFDFNEMVVKKILEITNNKYSDFITAKDFGNVASELNKYFNHIIELKKAYSNSLEGVNCKINEWREILEEKLIIKK
jgi:hypothetical protein